MRTRARTKKKKKKLLGYKTAFTKQKFSLGLINVNRWSLCDTANFVEESSTIYAVVSIFHLQFWNVWFGAVLHWLWPVGDPVSSIKKN